MTPPTGVVAGCLLSGSSYQLSVTVAPTAFWKVPLPENENAFRGPTKLLPPTGTVAVTGVESRLTTAIDWLFRIPLAKFCWCVDPVTMIPLVTNVPKMIVLGSAAMLQGSVAAQLVVTVGELFAAM